MRIVLACATAVLLGLPVPEAAVARQVPEQKVFRTESHPQLRSFLYAPRPAEGTEGTLPRPAPSGTPVIFYSGEWGWTPLQQDAASSLSAAGRYILGIDSPEYFNRMIPADILAVEFERFRGFLNERASRPKDAPVILVGFAAGAEIVPYLLNRIGPAGVRGVVLIAPDKKGAHVFRVSVQLRMDSPPEETFDVEAELRRMAPLPVVLMEGSLDPRSQAKALSETPRGPHKYAPVVGGDRQFHEVRDGFFRLLDDALLWIEGTAGPPG